MLCGRADLGRLYRGVILKQATTARRRCLDSSLCHTMFLDFSGCSVCVGEGVTADEMRIKTYFLKQLEIMKVVSQTAML